VRLRGGGGGGAVVTLRALVPEDRALIADAFERLSERSRFLRFFSPLPRLPKRTLEALVDVDHVDHAALIALHGDAGVGVARYVRDREDPTRADFAITVVDAFQGRGLGRALMVALGDAAARCGVERFMLDVHPDNRVMLSLARSLGARLAFRDGVMTGTVDVPLQPSSARLRAAAA
jgi:GNAT superfamily N-acetyltransferase